jgi:hypothetical protein
VRQEHTQNVVCEGPLRVASFRWRLASGEPALTVICKATYVLEPTESSLAPQRDDPSEDDKRWDDDPARSLAVASDFVPFKARAEVVLVGSAFAPEKQPVRSLVARLLVGSVDKSVEVHADRWWTLGGELREGLRFASMPLRYERAAGGPDTANPAGMRSDVTDSQGAVAVPNLLPPGSFVARRGDPIDPIGFGPVAPEWPSRREKLARHAAWFARDWRAQPLPPDFDAGFFNVAPRDQQLDVLRPNERIVLEGLHRDYPRLVTSLPGVYPRATVKRPGLPPEELSLRCETLCIDTDRGTCTLVWRGSVPLAHLTEGGWVVVTTEGTAAPAAAAASSASETVTPDRSRVMRMTLPFMRQQVDAVASPRSSRPDGALPFVQSGAAPLDAPPPSVAAPRDFAGPAPAMTVPAPSPLGMSSVMAAPSPLGMSSVMAAPLGMSTMMGAPSSLSPVPPPAPVAPAPPPLIRMPAEPSAWAPVEARTDRPSIGQSLLAEAKAAEEKAAVERRAGEASESRAAMGAPALVVTPGAEAREANLDDGAAKRGWKPAGAPRGVSPPIARDAPQGSALGASNAAAAALARAPAAEPAPGPRAGASPREVIELVWLDPAWAGRMRRRPGWKEIMAQAKARPIDDDIPGDAPPERRQEARDRREVSALLARGEPADMRGVDEAISSAVGEDGTFIPPLVLVAGELELPFDEVEGLKATIAAVTPLIAGDKRLQEAVDTAEKLLQTPWRGEATEIAAGLTGKIKEAFAQGSRALPPRYLEQHTARMLLRRRAYQKRTVLGKACLRGILSLAGANEGLPVYLPETLKDELPAFERFTVRMIAEARMRLDQEDTPELALRGVALGRVTGRR